MRVWIGCLSCYNAGRLVGKWFDAIEAGEVTSNQVHGYNQQAWMRTRDERGVIERLVDIHEELWVMDMDETCGWLREECSPGYAQQVAELIEEIEGDHVDPSMVSEWAAHEGITSQIIEEGWFCGGWNRSWDDAYCGEYDNERDYAYTLADDIGMLSELTESLSYYFDYDAFARDLFMGDNYSINLPGGGIAVFRNY